MKTGKLVDTALHSQVIDKIRKVRDDILIGPETGEDCAAIDFGELSAVLSTDPITGASSEVGALAVHINCNDIASSGAEPVALLLTILAPVGTSEETIGQIMDQAAEEAAKMKVEIIGGHTEVTEAVNRILVSATAIGKAEKDKLVSTGGAKDGDAIIMTKWAALEGTGILAYDYEDRLVDHLGRITVTGAQEMLSWVSVVPEGRICGDFGVNAMHDATEGGILGAIWELCQAAKLGCKIDTELIPLRQETKDICEHFEIDPLELISSGVMLITVEKDRSKDLMDLLESKGIPATCIGHMRENPKLWMVTAVGKIPIDPPKSDALYRINVQ